MAAVWNVKVPEILDAKLEAYCALHGVSKASVIKLGVASMVEAHATLERQESSGEVVRAAELLEQSGRSLTKGLGALGAFVEIMKGRSSRGRKR
jgi:hypothetical protein